jgi:quinol monooxygenase YgiN
MSVQMTVEWLVPAGQTRPITLALHSLASEIRTVRGCVGCSVSTDLSNRGAIRYVEEWQSEPDLRARVGSEGFLRLAALIDAAAEAPHIEFALPEGTRGFDFVVEVRGAPLA